jgi:hypothetical protein
LRAALCSFCLFCSFHRSCHSFIAACFRRCCSQADMAHRSRLQTLPLSGARGARRLDPFAENDNTPRPPEFMRNDQLLSSFPGSCHPWPAPHNPTKLSASIKGEAQGVEKTGFPKTRFFLDAVMGPAPSER